MSLVKQIGLLSAGCQPWNMDVCASNGDRFAYCATLAVYIYELDKESIRQEYKLKCIMAEHSKTIVSMAWSPYNADLIVTAGADEKIIIWNVALQSVVAKLENITPVTISVGWGIPNKDNVYFISGRGPLQSWNGKSTNVIAHRYIRSFSSEVSIVRYHPQSPDKIVTGHENGSLSFFSQGGEQSSKHAVRIHHPDEDEPDKDPIKSLEWDPLSVDCVLAASQDSGVVLVEVNRCEIIMRFNLPSAAATVYTLSWIQSAPGMFVTGDYFKDVSRNSSNEVIKLDHNIVACCTDIFVDSKHGVLRIWNVSQSSPIESIKIKSTGFHTVHVLNSDLSCKSISKSNGSTGNDIKIKTESPDHSGAKKRSVPLEASILCTFIDGGVGLYNLKQKKWNFLRELAHIETIFDCQFHPDNENILATVSFDGAVKVWDVTTMKAISSSAGNEGVLYSISWAPSDIDCIAVATGKHGLFVWDMKKSKVVKRFKEHAPGTLIYCVAWNQKDYSRIASAGSDNLCIIRRFSSTDGKNDEVVKYAHPSPVQGCDWSPHNADMLATGCADGKVRIYYLLSHNDNPLKIYSGHKSKVFRVKWSPLREGILVSGSDDNTVRMWDYTQEGSCVRVFQGHTAPVRGLSWNPEIPYLMMSGSWDSTIRVWDVRDGACLETITDHGADIYGITCHSKRPFVMASCSRDSTLRLWNLSCLVQPVQMNILAGRSWDDFIVSPEQAMTNGIPPLLTGKISRDIKVQMEKIHDNKTMRKKLVEEFSKFFANPEGSSNLWDLIGIKCGLTTDQLSEGYEKGILHAKHITIFNSASAQKCEMTRWSKFGAGLGAPSRADQLREAASLQIRLGNIQKYCQLLVELDEWDKALAIAPSVSFSFWKSLVERRAKLLKEEESDEVVPYCAASGDSEGLIEFFTRRGQLQEALIVAAASDHGSFVQPRGESEKSRSGEGRLTERSVSVGTGDNGQLNTEDTGSDTVYLQQASSTMADWYFTTGSPILSACCHLVTEDVNRAMSKLIRGCEWELAASVGLVLSPEVDSQLTAALNLLSRRCERLGYWSLGVDLLKVKKVDDLDIALVKLCSRCAASMTEINALHAQAGFPSMEECRRIADDTNEDDKTVVKYYMLSVDQHIGLQIGLDLIKNHLLKSSWKAGDVFEMLHLISAIKTDNLQKQKCSKLMQELLILCAYVGALVAIRRKFDTIIVPLFGHAVHLMGRWNTDLPLSAAEISREIQAWKAKHVTDRSALNSNSTHGGRKNGDDKLQDDDELGRVYSGILRRAGQTKSSESSAAVEVGPYRASGSELPSHSDVHCCVLTGNRIQGPVFFLEDGRSAMSYNDAVMWALVNPFSPTGSGVRINPF